MKKWRTWLAWGAPIWLLMNQTALWLASSLLFDWWCGLPGKDTCNFGELHPVLQIYLRLSLVGMCVLVAVTAFFALRGRLTKIGLGGLFLSLALGAGLAVITFSGA